MHIICKQISSNRKHHCEPSQHSIKISNHCTARKRCKSNQSIRFRIPVPFRLSFLFFIFSPCQQKSSSAAPITIIYVFESNPESRNGVYSVACLVPSSQPQSTTTERIQFSDDDDDDVERNLLALFGSRPEIATQSPTSEDIFSESRRVAKRHHSRIIDWRTGGLSLAFAVRLRVAPSEQVSSTQRPSKSLRFCSKRMPGRSFRSYSISRYCRSGTYIGTSIARGKAIHQFPGSAIGLSWQKA